MESFNKEEWILRNKVDMGAAQVFFFVSARSSLGYWPRHGADSNGEESVCDSFISLLAMQTRGHWRHSEKGEIVCQGIVEFTPTPTNACIGDLNWTCAFQHEFVPNFPATATIRVLHCTCTDFRPSPTNARIGDIHALHCQAHHCTCICRGW